MSVKNVAEKFQKFKNLEIMSKNVQVSRGTVQILEFETLSRRPALQSRFPGRRSRK